MQLPKSLTTVTSFSKLLALSMLILFPIAAFWLGVYYQQSKPAKTEYIPQEKIVKVYPSESRFDLLHRCGDYPANVMKATPCGQWNDCGMGPSWSSDCRYIAWSLSRGGPTWEGPLDPGEMITPFSSLPTPADEGVFLYEDKTGLIKTIYHPVTNKDVRSFTKWKNSQEFEFASESRNYSYDIFTGQITSE